MLFCRIVYTEWENQQHGALIQKGLAIFPEQPSMTKNLAGNNTNQSNIIAFDYFLYEVLVINRKKK